MNCDSFKHHSCNKIWQYKMFQKGNKMCIWYMIVPLCIWIQRPLPFCTVCYTDSSPLGHVCCSPFLRKKKHWKTRKGKRHFLDLFSIKSSDKFATHPPSAQKSEKMKNWKWNRRQDAYLNIYMVLAHFVGALWFDWLFMATHCTVLFI